MKLGFPPQLRLGVVGSRDFPRLRLVGMLLILFLDEHPELVIVSGGARGIDSEAEKFADENKLEKIIFPVVDWSIGKHAGHLRNTDIVNASDYVISFQCKKSRGTQDSIDKATKANKYIGNVTENGEVELSELGKRLFPWLT